MIKDIFIKIEDGLDKAIHHLKEDFLGLQAGQATPSLVENILINAYGLNSPIKNNASIICSQIQQIHISPWDKGLLGVIEKAIRDGDMGFNPINNGSEIIVSVPALTEEKRNHLIKIINKKGEETKIVIRQLRHNGKVNIERMKECDKDSIKKNIEELEKLIKIKNTLVDEIVKNKSISIMKV